MEKLDVTSRETVRQFVKRGLLPPPMKDPGGGPNYWLEKDIDTYITSLAEKRNQAAAGVV